MTQRRELVESGRSEHLFKPPLESRCATRMRHDVKGLIARHDGPMAVVRYLHRPIPRYQLNQPR